MTRRQFSLRVRLVDAQDCHQRLALRLGELPPGPPRGFEEIRPSSGPHFLQRDFWPATASAD